MEQTTTITIIIKARIAHSLCLRHPEHFVNFRSVKQRITIAAAGSAPGAEHNVQPTAAWTTSFVAVIVIIGIDYVTDTTTIVIIISALATLS